MLCLFFVCLRKVGSLEEVCKPFLLSGIGRVDRRVSGNGNTSSGKPLPDSERKRVVPALSGYGKKTPVNSGKFRHAGNPLSVLEKKRSERGEISLRIAVPESDRKVTRSGLEPKSIRIRLECMKCSIGMCFMHAGVFGMLAGSSFECMRAFASECLSEVKLNACIGVLVGMLIGMLAGYEFECIRESS